MAFGFGQYMVVILQLVPQMSTATGPQVTFLLVLLVTFNSITKSNTISFFLVMLLVDLWSLILPFLCHTHLFWAYTISIKNL